jgi:hypothetical protein
VGFTKLDEGILRSSIMAEDPVTFKVWIAFLASCEPDGIARVSSVFIASVCRFTQEQVDKAVKRLSRPDLGSRSEEHEGRRIQRVDGGYLIFNYEKYRAFSYSMKRDAVRKREQREKAVGHSRDNVPLGVGHSASASASSSVLVKEGECEGEQKGLLFIGESVLSMVKKTFEEGGYKFDDKTIVGVARLCMEFKDLDHVEQLKSKMAWWVNKPLTPKQNVVLQIRNWFKLAVQFEARDKGARMVGVGAPLSDKDKVIGQKAAAFARQLWDEEAPALDAARAKGVKEFERVRQEAEGRIASKVAEYSRKLRGIE